MKWLSLKTNIMVSICEENSMIIAILQAEILRCIFLPFCLYVFFLSIISFGEKMQRRTKAAHNEHYRDKFLIIKKKKKKEELKERKKNISLETL